MKAVIGWEDTIDGTCGVGVFGGFIKEQGGVWGNGYLPEEVECSGGAGWQLAGFVPTPECKQIYQAFKKRFKIVYQSPVRENTNSHNPFFFCIYDVQAETKPNTTRRWPFTKQQMTEWAEGL